MANVMELLEKILNLEEAQGYKNQAVFGGLDRFAAIWSQEAATLNPQKPVEAIARYLQQYPNEGLEGRRQLVERIRHLLIPVEILHKKAERPASKKPKPAPRPKESLSPDDPVTALPGIREASARKLARLEIYTLGDILYHFPHRYEDYSALKSISQLLYGEEATIIAAIQESFERNNLFGKRRITCLLSDGTATLQATWFNLPTYLTGQLKEGNKFVFSGQVGQYRGRLTMVQPSWEAVDQELIHTGRLVPVYPLTQGVGPRWLRRLIKGAVDSSAPRLQDPLPAEIKSARQLLSLQQAISHIHFPDNWETLKAARRRLAFDEFLTIQLGVLRKRQEWKAAQGRALIVEDQLLDAFIKSLPFTLTSAQKRVLLEILQDMQTAQPMSRLLQGDVGSGKTVVAATAMLVAINNETQAALMAPTEILAEQHFATLQTVYQGIELQDPKTKRRGPIQVRLLTGSLAPQKRAAIYQEISRGETRVIVGTHALIQAGIEFQDLGLVIIDEQHRFGVRQRQTLREKGIQPHLLVMSATPIPRTLALTLYGDLDISIIDEFPPGRKEISTRWLNPGERAEAYQFIREQVSGGHQAFIVCPLIEESEKIEAAAATEEYKRLKGVFPDLRLGLIHGRLGTRDKDKVMRSFYQGGLDILVATPVVEVGIDVPNATVLLVEAADRFGLAQLHQFRGRIGRGPAQSYCLLLSQSPSLQAEERLRIIETTRDGFRLAEEDLRMRGPGEFFGTRQSGLPELKVAKLGDLAALEEAREVAQAIFAADPTLGLEVHRGLGEKVEAFWQEASEPI